MKSKRYPMPPGRHDEALEAAGYCCVGSEHGLPAPCFGRLVVHHKRMRGSGGTSDPSIHDLENLAVLCGGVTGRDGHHGYVHDNPAESYENGLLVRRAGLPTMRKTDQ